MTKTEHFPAAAEARPHGNRAHGRRKLSPMAYVELGQDNGGILLNLSEGGFAVQSALALTSREFSELRFQVPALQGWLTARGRIVWISDSKKEAGIQFTELPGEARADIQQWVAGEDAPEKVTERIPVAARPSIPAAPEKPSESRADAPHRSGGGRYEPAGAYDAQANGTQPENERAQTQRETVGVAVAEAPPQDFHFTDYSMFAAAPEREGVWAQPARHKGGWRAAVLGILVAVLFFALGATVGRETVDRWIGHAGAWTQSQLTTAPAPKVTPPAPPEQAAAADAANDRTAQSTAGENQTEEKSVGTPGANPGPAARSDGAKVAGEAKGDIETPTAKAEAASGGSARDAASTGASSARSANAAGGSGRRAGHLSEDVVPRENRQTIADPIRTSTEHSILVNAPEPGSAPFVVHFSNDAVSASGAIAMSARRSLEILPRSSAAASGAERVVIGKLIVHSEPFYPAEARSRGIEGSVELRARVGRTGGVVGVTPVSGPSLLFPAAVAAVREWRYEPTYVNGDPAETLADITIAFRLR
ncbi:MAG: Ferric siderophore transport system, periplasmic binding protein TonB [Candidatus Acidoferrum typicum]|nr:Ferric siderophore transport system, periplasmic binding protein TonB [Candidatus Acidoferrum typicum]